MSWIKQLIITCNKKYGYICFFNYYEKFCLNFKLNYKLVILYENQYKILFLTNDIIL